MSTTHHVADRWAVTRYVGPGELGEGRKRLRWRVDSPDGSVYGMDANLALAVGVALIRAVIETYTTVTPDTTDRSK